MANPEFFYLAKPFMSPTVYDEKGDPVVLANGVKFFTDPVLAALDLIKPDYVEISKDKKGTTLVHLLSNKAYDDLSVPVRIYTFLATYFVNTMTAECKEHYMSVRDEVPILDQTETVSFLCFLMEESIKPESTVKVLDEQGGMLEV